MTHPTSLNDTVRHAHLTAAGTAINRSGQAKLMRVVVNDPADTTLTVYESSSNSGQVLAVVDCNNAGTFEYGVTLSGLTVDLAGTADVTVVYQ